MMVIKLKNSVITFVEHGPNPLNMGFKLRVFEFCKHRQVNGVGQQQIIKGFGNGGAQDGREVWAVQGQVNVGTWFVVSLGT